MKPYLQYLLHNPLIICLIKEHLQSSYEWMRPFSYEDCCHLSNLKTIVTPIKEFSFGLAGYLVKIPWVGTSGWIERLWKMNAKFISVGILHLNNKIGDRIENFFACTVGSWPIQLVKSIKGAAASLTEMSSWERETVFWFEVGSSYSTFKRCTDQNILLITQDCQDYVRIPLCF